MRRLFLNYFLFLLFVLVLVWFGAAPLIERVGSAPFREDYERYYRELMRGGFAVVERELLRLPEGAWPERLETLRPDFGYPLELIAMQSLELSARDRAVLDRGEIVVGAGYDQFWGRVGDSDVVLVMGPFPAPQVGRSVDVFIWLLVLFTVGLATLAWALPFARKLRDFRRTAAEFGEGRFRARAQMPGHSPLAPLATSFNQMADRIEQLVTSHKELTNAVAHELRTPIARIRFGLEMATSAPEADARARYAEGVRRDVDELEALVEELLVYARFDRTAPDLERTARAIGPWLREVVDGLRTDTRAGIELSTDVTEDTTVAFDARHLGRAIENLVHNADRYGGGHVRVTLETDARECRVHVDDDGPGIPVADRDRVFEPFARLDHSRSRASGGFGLGLAIVRRVAEAHGGRVDLDDSELGGCRFSLRWPRS